MKDLRCRSRTGHERAYISHAFGPLANGRVLQDILASAKDGPDNQMGYGRLHLPSMFQLWKATSYKHVPSFLRFGWFAQESGTVVDEQLKSHGWKKRRNNIIGIFTASKIMGPLQVCSFVRHW